MKGVFTMDSQAKGKLIRGNRIIFYLVVFLSCLSLIIILSSGFIYFKYQKTILNMFDDQISSSRVKTSVVPVYCALEPFTLNVISGQSSAGRVLHLGLTLKVKDGRTINNLKKYLPEIRSRLLVLFSQQKSDDILMSEGKMRLVDEIKETLSKPIDGEQQLFIVDVLFNTFIIR